MRDFTNYKISVKTMSDHMIWHYFDENIYLYIYFFKFLAGEERNYHVFYELLEGMSKEQKDKYGLMSADKYFYLNQGGQIKIDGKNDKDDFETMQSALQVLSFSTEECETIYKILASILHLGNVYFHRKQVCYCFYSYSVEYSAHAGSAIY